MQSLIELKQLKRSKPLQFYNHKYNRVSYSLDQKESTAATVDFSRYSVNSKNSAQPVNSRYLRISKSLQKIKQKDSSTQSLSSKIEERMKIRRAMELERLFEDNTRMFARIYTQKSEYKKDPSLVKRKRRYGKQSFKENQTEVEREGKGNQESKIMKMRMVCGGQKTTVLPYLKERLGRARDNSVKRGHTEGVYGA